MPSTAACVRDFAKRRPGDYGLLADYCGVEANTVLSWFGGKQLPKGETLIKLRCFMELAGYKVDELHVLSPVALRFAQMIGYGMISAEDVRVLLDYGDMSGVYNTLLQGKAVLPSRRYRLERLSNEYANEVAAKGDQLRADINPSGEVVTDVADVAEPVVEPSSNAVPAPVVAEVPVYPSSAAIQLATAHTIRALYALACDMEQNDQHELLRDTVAASLDRDALVHVQQMLNNVLDAS
jgi:hypothetical protein